MGFLHHILVWMGPQKNQLFLLLPIYCPCFVRILCLLLTYYHSSSSSGGMGVWGFEISALLPFLYAVLLGWIGVILIGQHWKSMFVSTSSRLQFHCERSGRFKLRNESCNTRFQKTKKLHSWLIEHCNRLKRRQWAWYCLHIYFADGDQLWKQYVWHLESARYTRIHFKL